MEESCFSSLLIQNPERELHACTALADRLRLSLSREDFLSLKRAQGIALARTGRIEFLGNTLRSILFALGDSPFIPEGELADTLSALIDLFYSLKSEAMDEIPDDELIDYMKSAFDGPAQGDLDFLCDMTLSDLCRSAQGNEGSMGQIGYSNPEGDPYDA